MKYQDRRRARLPCQSALKSTACMGEHVFACALLQEQSHDPQLPCLARSPMKSTEQPIAKPPSELMTPEEVLEMLSVSKSWLYAKVKDGEFPPPIKLSHKVARWRRYDIEMYIEELEAD